MFDAWCKATKEYDAVNSIGADNFKHKLKEEKVQVIDVRKEGEFVSEHLENAKNTPLDFLNDHFDKFPKEYI